MSIEYLIAFYMLVCVMMTGFNFAFLFYEKVHTRRFEKKMARMAVELAEEIERNADFPTERHCRFLESRMRWLSGMEAFDLSMEKLSDLDSGKSEHYLRGISSVFEHSTYRFARKDDLKCAYFAYIVGRWYRKRPASDVVLEALLHYVRERSFYARQNALQALSALGDEKTMVDAALALDRADVFHHPKLLTEALLAFEGNRAALAHCLIACFEDLHPASQVAVVNFVRMAVVGRADCSEDELEMHRVWALGLLRDARVDAEVRLACIRYFMRWPWSEAADVLRELALRDTPEEWEFAAVAATALSAYPGERTVSALKHCLRSPMWHVRHNAAKSLFDMGLSLKDDLADVMAGDDPYARDMLQYWWEYETLRAGGQGQPEEEGATSLESETQASAGGSVKAAWSRLSASIAAARKVWRDVAALRARMPGEEGESR